VLLYFGILFQNNCGSLWHLHLLALLLILLLCLPCPRISYTLNTKPFFLNNPFLLSLVRTNFCRFFGLLTLLTVFIWQSCSRCRSSSQRSSTSVSVNKCLSVIAAWQALFRHFYSSHRSSVTMVSEAIINYWLITPMVDRGLIVL